MTDQQYLALNDAEVRFSQVYDDIQQVAVESYDQHAQINSNMNILRHDIDTLLSYFNYTASLLNDLLSALNEAKESEKWDLTDVDTSALDEFLRSISIIERG